MNPQTITVRESGKTMINSMKVAGRKQTIFILEYQPNSLKYSNLVKVKTAILKIKNS